MSTSKEDEWNTEDWKRKLRQQAEETREYRYKIYERADLKTKKKILDVGCGTGAITADLASLTSSEVIGLDIDPEKLKQAEILLSDLPNVTLMEGDVLNLPFEDETFDLVVFNILLMYIKDKQKAVDEMTRVVKKGGIVLATLEPDYAGIIEYPENPTTPLLIKQMEELGADLYAGRKLKFLFNTAGLKTVVKMDIDADFILPEDDDKILKLLEDEFWMFEKLLQKNGWTTEEIEKFRIEETEIIRNGLSFSLMPMFYAIGRKK
jgi:ubiquinone/menaquinone biosynthesis C-methylase UbiE